MRQGCLNKYRSFKSSDFYPSPVKIFEELAQNPGVSFAFIHGSFIYKKEILGATYCETRVFDSEHKLVESQFDLVIQPPDLDAVICVKDSYKFELDISEDTLDLLNYFLTINVILLDVFHKEIVKVTPTAMKTILAFRKTLDFGEVKELKKARATAISSITNLDRDFQEQYDNRKRLYSKNILKGVGKFKLTRRQYLKHFPLLLQSYEGKLEAAFPKERLKLVYPYDMGLKKKVFCGQEDSLENLL